MIFFYQQQKRNIPVGCLLICLGKFPNNLAVEGSVNTYLTDISHVKRVG